MPAKETAPAVVPDPALDTLGTMDVDQARLLSMQRADRYIEIIDEADKRHLGDWYGVPERLQKERWHFVRCGRRGAKYAEGLARQLINMGWIDCRRVAPVARPALFESDGDDGLYLCCPETTYVNIKRAKAELQARKARMIAGEFDGAVADLNRMGGVSAETSASTQIVTPR